MDRQKGSHMVLRQPEAPFRRVTVPDHKEIAKGTLRSILRHAGLTVDELVELRRWRIRCVTGRVRHIQ
jgi:hypothetical protein